MAAVSVGDALVENVVPDLIRGHPSERAAALVRDGSSTTLERVDRGNHHPACSRRSAASLPPRKKPLRNPERFILR